MLQTDHTVAPEVIEKKIARLWELSGPKILAIEENFNPTRGAPVFTAGGKYTSRGWTEWTQGFQFGSALLQFDATGDRRFLELGRHATVRRMAPHVTHAGVHDHGFNNISTYGNLLRLMNENRVEENPWERDYYGLALKCSGATQARRWTQAGNGLGFIYSFNGPHSLFVDTIRTLRVLAVADRLGHAYLEEGDRHISLLERVILHARATATYSVYYGEGRDIYDVRGRVAHECLFNTNNGNFRCPNTQQGYSAFSTWTRGLAWAMCGFAELLEFIGMVPDADLVPWGGRADIDGFMLRAARATCDFYIEHATPDGIPYWDTGAPGLPGGAPDSRSDPWSSPEPLDSSAASIAAQGLLRLARHLDPHLAGEESRRYWRAGLTILDTLLDEPYLSTDPAHQGLILHSVYHRPNGWDYIPSGRRAPCGESSMWGDYHARELALYVQRVLRGEAYLSFASAAKRMKEDA